MKHDRKKVPDDTDRPLVLIVDDDENNLVVMEALFETDYRVLTAQSGHDALRLLDKHSPDLVISDQRMPFMTGVELLDRVRRIRPDAVRIILTGYPDVDTVMEAIGRGQVYRYVLKPWRIDEMRITVGQALEWGAACRDRTQLLERLERAARAIGAGNAELEKIDRRAVAAEKLACAGRLAAEMCHDLANMAQVISATASEIASGAVTEPVEAARALADCAERLGEAVAVLRDLAGGARLPFAVQTEDAAALLGQAVRMIGHHPATIGRRIVVDGPPNLPWRLDRRQVFHLMLNLLRNAVEASPEGGEVRAGVRVEGGALHVTVADGGSGVPEAIRSRIFEPFFTTKNGGTGLGLSVCKSAVDAHGGTIRVADLPSGGALFEAVLPAPPNGVPARRGERGDGHAPR